MTFPVRIEMGNHVIHTQMHALPRVGDRINCAFPASGVPRMHLIVKTVRFHQTADFEGRESKEPFAIVVFTDGDPDPELRKLNEEAMAKVMSKG